MKQQVTSETEVGAGVLSTPACPYVPPGTRGVVDQVTDRALVVAWDLPENPLPYGYRAFDAQVVQDRRIRRDAFGLSLPHVFLELVGCDCQSPGIFNPGLPGVVAFVKDGAVRSKVERCDLCERYASDEQAAGALREFLAGGRP
jgi:hypothetical protein